jgi:hypothetical protein
MFKGAPQSQTMQKTLNQNLSTLPFEGCVAAAGAVASAEARVGATSAHKEVAVQGASSGDSFEVGILPGAAFAFGVAPSEEPLALAPCSGASGDPLA